MLFRFLVFLEQPVGVGWSRLAFDFDLDILCVLDGMVFVRASSNVLTVVAHTEVTNLRLSALSVPLAAVDQLLRGATGREPVVVERLE